MSIKRAIVVTAYRAGGGTIRASQGVGKRELVGERDRGIGRERVREGEREKKIDREREREKVMRDGAMRERGGRDDSFHYCRYLYIIL